MNTKLSGLAYYQKKTIEQLKVDKARLERENKMLREVLARRLKK